ncbi:MAG: hypothetical protein DSY81_08250 [Bacillota bacterium]|nr:MAG: hypothetical protein DSY92_07360 [Planctomycetota bacterium]RUA08814.1 MAG: hypothetical protein DSY81_08250 [Bacillota bacterium]
MHQPDDRIRASHCSQQGMALFVVLILVLVLTVVITQLLFVTKIEERISRNRQGRVSLSYAVQATARQVLQSLSSDLMADLGYFDDDIEDDSLLGSSGGGGTQLPGGITLPGSGGGTTPGSNGESNTPADTPHDVWAYPIQDSINQVQITGLVIDGESCIDLNHIFKLVLIAEEDSEADGDSSGGSTEPGGEAGDEELLEEYIIPEQEEVDDATVMLERLIEAVIDFNSESGFDYNDVPHPQGAAEAIVSMVYQRVLDEQTRRIRSLDSIRHLDEVSWELFNGPIDPATLEEDYEEERGNPDEWMDDIGSLLPGSFDGLEAAGFELLDGGVDQIPTPIGLRHVLTANSTGKINLNTARPEVLIALMRSFDDFDEAREIAWQIRDHCNSYQQEIDDVTGEILEDLLGDIGVDEEIEQQFQHFTSFDQLKQVDESWEDGGASEDSIFALLQQDLEEHSTFSSNFFTTTIEGTSEGRSLSGRMVCARKGQHVLVISWKEVRR